MDTYLFLGSTDTRAISLDKQGGNLPIEYGPWVKDRMIQLSEKNQDDRFALSEVQSNGFYLFLPGMQF
jgi:hypothetical protein